MKRTLILGAVTAFWLAGSGELFAQRGGRGGGGRGGGGGGARVAGGGARVAGARVGGAPVAAYRPGSGANYYGGRYNGGGYARYGYPGYGYRGYGYGGYGLGGLGLAGLGLGYGLGYGGLGYGGLGYGGYGSGGYGSGGYGSSAYGPYNPQPIDPNQLPPASDSQAPSSIDAMVRAAVANNQGILQVLVPAPDAQITLNTTVMPSTGPERVFFTPALEPASLYSYSITARWTQNGQPMTDSRTVNVAARSISVVDFTRPAPTPPKAD